MDAAKFIEFRRLQMMNSEIKADANIRQPASTSA